MFAWFSQIVAVTALNLRTIKERLASSLVAVIGIAGVVSVVVAVLSIAAGLRATMAGTGSEDTVLVLRGGSDTEMVSGLSGDEARIVEDAPASFEMPRAPSPPPSCSSSSTCRSAGPARTPTCRCAGSGPRPSTCGTTSRSWKAGGSNPGRTR